MMTLIYEISRWEIKSLNDFEKLQPRLTFKNDDEYTWLKKTETYWNL